MKLKEIKLGGVVWIYDGKLGKHYWYRTKETNQGSATRELLIKMGGETLIIDGGEWA